jgi:AraC-like DNA-binding protein
MISERLKLYRSPGAVGVELMDVTSSDRCWRVVHDRYCVAICVAGATEYRYRARAFTKTAGVVTLHEPGEAYSARRQHGLGAATVFSIDPATFTGWDSREPLEARHFVPGPGAEPALIRRWSQLAKAIRTSRSSQDVEAALGSAMAEIFASRAEGAWSSGSNARGSNARADKKEHRAVAYVKARLQEGVHEKISLEQLATEVGLHKLYLLGVFRDQVGVPPHTYQLQIRVARARSLLSDGARIGDVVTKLGFSDQSHLSRHFRRAFGVPPGTYAALIRSTRALSREGRDAPS